MGTWAEGIYENDVAADHVYDLLDRLVEQIKEAVADPVRLLPDEDDSPILLANVDLLRLISTHVHKQVWFTWGIRGPMLPDADTILAWRSKYLAAWDEAIDGLDPQGDYKRKHRQVIVKTFDRLAEASRRQDQGPPSRTRKARGPTRGRKSARKKP
jgi:hypothetical protein